MTYNCILYKICHIQFLDIGTELRWVPEYVAESISSSNNMITGNFTHICFGASAHRCKLFSQEKPRMEVDLIIPQLLYT